MSGRSFRTYFAVLLLFVLRVVPSLGQSTLDALDLKKATLDTLSKVPAKPLAAFVPSLFSTVRGTAFLTLPYGVTDQDQQAFISEALAQTSVMASVQRSLQPELNAVSLRPWMVPMAFAASFFMTYPFSIPDGYVPFFNHSNYLSYIKIPGWAPYENPTSPDNIPQAVRLVYDDRTSTYKQVMVPWQEYQKQTEFYFGKDGKMNNATLPVVRMNSYERMLFQGR